MTGKIWRTTPPSPAATSAARPSFQPRQLLRKIRLGRVEPFSFPLRQSSCLGHCITRGLGLRRQAKIFRLRGAALLRVRKQAAGEFGRIRGVESLQREQFCRAVGATKACVRDAPRRLENRSRADVGLSATRRPDRVRTGAPGPFASSQVSSRRPVKSQIVVLINTCNFRYQFLV